MNKSNLSAVVSAALFLSLFTGCTNDNNTMPKGFAVQDRNIVNQNQVNITSNKNFSDVPSGAWYADNVQWGSSLGIIDGYPDGTFQPTNH